MTFFRSWFSPSGDNLQFHRYLKLLCFTWKSLNLKLIQIIIDHADHNLSSLSLHVLLKKGPKVCFKSMKLEKIGRRNMFQVHLFLLRVVLLLLLLPQIIRPGFTVRFHKKKMNEDFDMTMRLLFCFGWRIPI